MNTYQGRTVLLTLPWPPSVNRLWRAVLGRIVLSKEAKAYHVKLANALPTGPVKPLTGRLSVSIVLHPPTKLKGIWDLGNREKIANDGLTKQRVWLDDSQIDILTISRGAPTKTGCACYTIREIAP